MNGHVAIFRLKMPIQYKLADQSDLQAMINIGDDLFDYPVKKSRAIEFLNDSRHHLFLAYNEDAIVGLASAFHYVHPDKNPNLFVNEVSVLESHRNQGIARTLVRKMIEYGKNELQCEEAWIATMNTNVPAQKAFIAAGGRREEEAVVLIEY